MICIRIGEMRICIEFGFLTVCALLCTISSGGVLAASLCAVLLHETAHIIAMAALKIKLSSITLHGCGVRICPETRLMGYGRELTVMLAGPAANILMWMILHFGGIWAEGAQAQLILGLLNLLPCRHLDGGAVLSCALGMMGTDARRAEITALSISVSVLLLCLVCGFFLGIGNFTYYVLLIYLIFAEFSR